jgi:hypothetical protein
MLIELSTQCNNEMTREDIITEVEQEIIKWKLAHHKGWQTFVRENGVLPQELIWLVPCVTANF